MGKKKNNLRQRIIHAHYKEMVLSRQSEPGPFSYILVLDSLKAGFNIPKIFRSANAFGCRELHLVNLPVFDPTPGRGTVKQTHSRSFATFAESYEALLAESYEIYLLDPEGNHTLGKTKLSQKSAFVLGHEEYGFSFDPKVFSALKRIKIPQFGQVQSLNVSVAASIAAFEWVRQHKA